MSMCGSRHRRCCSTTRCRRTFPFCRAARARSPRCVARRRRWWTVPSTRLDDTAPSARPVPPGPRPLLRTPERRLSSLEACHSLRSPPQARPKVEQPRLFTSRLSCRPRSSSRPRSPRSARDRSSRPRPFASSPRRAARARAPRRARCTCRLPRRSDCSPPRGYPTSPPRSSPPPRPPRAPRCYGAGCWSRGWFQRPSPLLERAPCSRPVVPMVVPGGLGAPTPVGAPPPQLGRWPRLPAPASARLRSHQGDGGCPRPRQVPPRPEVADHAQAACSELARLSEALPSCRPLPPGKLTSVLNSKQAPPLAA